MADEGLSAGAVARRLGVAVTTLRTWHQRYGLGPSGHVPGHHRRYTTDDLARLEVMRRLTAEGVAAADAARWARYAPELPPRSARESPGSATEAPPSAQEAPPSARESPGSATEAPGSLTEASPSAQEAPPSARESPGSATEAPGSVTASPSAREAPRSAQGAPRSAQEAAGVPRPATGAPGFAPEAPGAPSSATEAPPARAGGGFAIPVGRAGPTARGLARAAMRLDAGAMREIMTRALADRGVVSMWDQVLRPVLAGIGERHSATKRLVEVEHLLSRTATEALATVPRPSGDQPPRVLLACADEEQHSLPLEALAAALAAEGVASRLLGARVPAAALADAVARTGPVVVMLWSHAPATAHVAHLAALRDAPRRPVLILAGGPGWPVDALPAGVVAPASLAEALQVTVAWARPAA